MSKASRSRSVKFGGRATEVDTTKASAERRIANIGGMLRIWASSRKSGDVEAEGTRETNQARLTFCRPCVVPCLVQVRIGKSLFNSQFKSKHRRRRTN